ncbi:hypothetical protein E4T56_gene1294 [Termitomyces sp. T112]|nr:hypothetical protein E4T56_gene1294 [Termitomyces sp. T112]
MFSLFRGLQSTQRFSGCLAGRVYSTITRSPPASAPRLAPTPLVFVSANDWDASSSNGVTYFSSMLAEKGYTCLQIDLRFPHGPIRDSEELMTALSTNLHDEIRLSIMPFPPIIFARSLSCLIAQTYVSSHPASGLFLISPPLSNASVSEAILPSKLPEFNFEAKFPIAMMAPDKEMQLLRAQHRFGNDPGVDMMPVADLESSHALATIEEWLDLVGV